MAISQTKVTELENLIGGPNKAANDQGSFEIDILRQARALREIAALQSSALTSGANRKRLLGSMANKLKPPGVTS